MWDLADLVGGSTGQLKLLQTAFPRPSHSQGRDAFLRGTLFITSALSGGALEEEVSRPLPSRNCLLGMRTLRSDNTNVTSDRGSFCRMKRFHSGAAVLVSPGWFDGRLLPRAGVGMVVKVHGGRLIKKKVRGLCSIATGEEAV